jgi:hypothetical protein
MNKPFTSMLAELSIYLGNKQITPTSSSEIDALSDEKDDPVGGMETPPTDENLPSDEKIADLDDTETDLDSLSLDQIIAALQAIKKSQEGEQDLGGSPVEPHSDFADVDPLAPPENVHPADNRMPDDGPTDDEGIPALPGMRKSPEDEQLAGSKTFTNPDEEAVDLEKDPEGTAPEQEDPLDQDQEDPLANPDELGSEVDTMSNGEPEQEDPNHMGTIRAVKGAHLVYKRQEGDGTFSELWMYNIGDHIDNAIAIKKAIIAGTDIQDNKMRSEDGEQAYELVTLGNAQMIKVTGLPG